jgi:hypothetical protein
MQRITNENGTSDALTRVAGRGRRPAAFRLGVVMIERIPAGARAALGALALLLPLAAPASAQRADFLFRRPSATLAVRGGWAIPRAQSEIFDFTRERLITRNQRDIGRDDFAGGAVQAELAVRVNDRFDVKLDVGHSEARIRSEFRDFVEDNDLPIEQETYFRRTPIELGAKAYLMERGRRVSRFAWVPYRWAPYVAGGLGAMVYGFEQSGDFVDYQTLDIFAKMFSSDGTTPTAHAAAGLDVSVHPHLLLTGEGRYQWARADMSRDFVDFDPIDLSGFQITVGIAARF